MFPSIVHPRGSFYDGTLTEVSGSGRVDLTHQFVVEPRLTLNVIDVRDRASPGR
jgi:hypothetical protein